MDKIYILQSMGDGESLRLEGDFSNIMAHAVSSSLQHLDKQPINCCLAADSGLTAVDLIYQYGMFFISEKFKSSLAEYGLDYLFYKPVNVNDQDVGLRAKYWLLVPPRIDCVDLSDLEEQPAPWTYEYGNVLPLLELETFPIDPDRVGRFSLFKLAGMLDFNIYLTEDLKIFLEARNLTGLNFVRFQ